MQRPVRNEVECTKVMPFYVDLWQEFYSVIMYSWLAAGTEFQYEFALNCVTGHVKIP